MAKTGITYNIQKSLAKITENKTILDGTYLTSSSNENFNEMVSHLYPGQEDRAKLLNPGSYLGNIVGDKIKNFVGEADTDYDISYDILTESILTRGQILLKYVLGGKKPKLEAVRAETYWESGGVEKIAQIYPVYEQQTAYGSPTYYLYVQSYDGKTLKNELFKINSLDNLSEGELVDLNKVYELSNLIPSQTITGMPRLVEVVNVADRPMMDTIKSVLYSIDRKLAEAEKHFNDYSEQFKIFQNIDIPKNAYTLINGVKIIDWDKLGKIVSTQEAHSIGDIKIIKNGNELLNDALKQVEKQIETISAITDIPLEFFGVAAVRDSGVGKEVGSANLFKRINKYRSKINTLLNKCFDFLSGFTKNVDKSIVWPAIIRSSENDVIMQQTILLQNNMTSLLRAIQVAHGVTEEQAKIILEEIKEDQSNGLLVSNQDTNKQADATAKTNASLK